MLHHRGLLDLLLLHNRGLLLLLVLVVDRLPMLNRMGVVEPLLIVLKRLRFAAGLLIGCPSTSLLLLTNRRVRFGAGLIIGCPLTSFLPRRGG